MLWIVLVDGRRYDSIGAYTRYQVTAGSLHLDGVYDAVFEACRRERLELGYIRRIYDCDGKCVSMGERRLDGMDHTIRTGESARSLVEYLPQRTAR